MPTSTGTQGQRTRPCIVPTVLALQWIFGSSCGPFQNFRPFAGFFVHVLATIRVRIVCTGRGGDGTFKKPVLHALLLFLRLIDGDYDRVRSRKTIRVPPIIIYVCIRVSRPGRRQTAYRASQISGIAKARFWFRSSEDQTARVRS